ncbi:hypothetical protein [Aeromicrobium sp. NPDC092404]|uniref:hypothetical protein n=1 Tax=Aeromicrobium sp. NPDC092404 TaxID=3154976 RepID=UPI0034242F37
MTASLGASLLVILTFFIALSTLLLLAVHMESTLTRPRPRRVRVAVRGGHASQPRSLR